MFAFERQVAKISANFSSSGNFLPTMLRKLSKRIAIEPRIQKQKLDPALSKNHRAKDLFGKRPTMNLPYVIATANGSLECSSLFPWHGSLLPTATTLTCFDKCGSLLQSFQRCGVSFNCVPRQGRHFTRKIVEGVVIERDLVTKCKIFSWGVGDSFMLGKFSRYTVFCGKKKKKKLKKVRILERRWIKLILLLYKGSIM